MRYSNGGTITRNLVLQNMQKWTYFNDQYSEMANLTGLYCLYFKKTLKVFKWYGLVISFSLITYNTWSKLEPTIIVIRF